MNYSNCYADLLPRPPTRSSIRLIAYEVIAKVGQLTESAHKGIDGDTVNIHVICWIAVVLLLLLLFAIPCFLFHFKLGQKVPLNQIMGTAHTVCRRNNWKVMLRHRLWTGRRRWRWLGDLNRKGRKLHMYSADAWWIDVVWKWFLQNFVAVCICLSILYFCELWMAWHTIYISIKLAFSQNKPTTRRMKRNDAWRREWIHVYFMRVTSVRELIKSQSMSILPEEQHPWTYHKDSRCCWNWILNWSNFEQRLSLVNAPLLLCRSLRKRKVMEWNGVFFEWETLVKTHAHTYTTWS